MLWATLPRFMRRGSRARLRNASAAANFVGIELTPLRAMMKSERAWDSHGGNGVADLAVGDLVVTEDGSRWRVHSITRDGAHYSVVTLHLASSIVLAFDAARLLWSEADGAWRLTEPGGE